MALVAAKSSGDVAVVTTTRVIALVCMMLFLSVMILFPDIK
jgi:hypothetical protein